MRLTFIVRLRLCFEILTAKSGHKGNSACEKQLSTFMRGYDAGMKDAKLDFKHSKN